MSMMIVDYDKYIEQISDALGDLKSETPKALRSALSATARKIRKEVVKDAEKRYEYQDSEAWKNSNKGGLKLKAGSKADRFYTKLYSNGPMNELLDFMVVPSEYRTTYRPNALGSKVLSSGALRILGDQPKPFIAKFKSGHIAVVQRTGKNPLPVKKLLSPSVPSMLGKAGLRETAEEKMASELPIQINKATERTFRKAGKK